jgi:hypothetical protein
MQSQATTSLYERLGGVYSIATVVDDFIDRIMDDPRLNSNPLVDEAHHRVSRAGFKYLVTEMVCWATGGPQQYFCTYTVLTESKPSILVTPVVKTHIVKISNSQGIRIPKLLLEQLHLCDVELEVQQN